MQPNVTTSIFAELYGKYITVLLGDVSFHPENR